MGPKLGLKTREEMMNFMIKRCGQKRVLEPYEIGKVATFLCKAQCSKIGKKVQFQKFKNTFFAISKMAKNQFLHQKKV